jgi:transposase
MNLNNIDLNKTKITTHNEGKALFISKLLDQVNFTGVINDNLTSSSGRNPDISYGTVGKMMIVTMCDDQHPLSRMDEYYKSKDLEGIFNEKIELNQINDDRFGGFLDRLYEANPRKIFSMLSANAFGHYGIKVNNINFDTTSKVMWGQYDTGSTEGEISITFGHSKQKRTDKKQLKIGLGTANGIVVDGKVLSGNMDDRTYNNVNLTEVEDVIKNLNIDKEKFIYIADSSLFTESNLKEAKSRNITLITSLPGTSTFAKDIKVEAMINFKNLKEVTINRKKGTTIYMIGEGIGDFKNHNIKYVYCYNESLSNVKEGKLESKKKAEVKKIKKEVQYYTSRKYACLEDATKEIKEAQKKKFIDIKFHDIVLSIEETEKSKRGRPSKNKIPVDVEIEYQLKIESKFNENKYNESLKQECIFTVCSNDTSLTGEEILREYKTQDSVEKRFQQLKSPQFVNSLYLESIKRIEAFVYLMLITLMVLSIAEYVVRRELKTDNSFIIGPGKIKMKQPTLKAIYQVFHTVQIIKISTPDTTIRQLNEELDDSVVKILSCLGISESSLTNGCK